MIYLLEDWFVWISSLELSLFFIFYLASASMEPREINQSKRRKREVGILLSLPLSLQACHRLVVALKESHSFYQATLVVCQLQ